MRQQLSRAGSFKEWVAEVNQAAAEPGFVASTVRNWHRDRPAPPEYLEAVSRRFGVDPSWLLLGEGDNPTRTLQAGSHADPLAQVFADLMLQLASRPNAWIVVMYGSSALVHLLVHRFANGPTPTVKAVLEFIDSHLPCLRPEAPVIKAHLESVFHSEMAAAWIRMEPEMEEERGP